MMQNTFPAVNMKIENTMENYDEIEGW